MNDSVFLSLAALYEKNGYRLYMVGGTSRDHLLALASSDYDFATDATPEEEKAFLPYASYVYAKYGSISFKISEKEIDITTFRQEKGYGDHRHPDQIVFVRDPHLDFVRRDFTINAIYIDQRDGILDYCGGLADLKNKIIRFIGDPDTRVIEDPLRILRAERFAARLGFSIEPKSLKAIERHRGLLSTLNLAKVKAELAKRAK